MRLRDRIKLIMRFIAKEIERCNYREDVDTDEIEEEVFRADARTDETGVVLGGWETSGGVPPHKARWYSIKLTKKNTPWAFEGGDPSTITGALELLATLSCVIAFKPRNNEAKTSREVLAFSAAKVNQENSKMVAKLMTSRFPLGAAMMQLSLIHI